jgi:hypothetical protein
MACLAWKIPGVVNHARFTGRRHPSRHVAVSQLPASSNTLRAICNAVIAGGHPA